MLVLALLLHVSGNVAGFYTTYAPVYDKISHFISAALVAMMGFVSVATLEHYTEIEMNRPMIAFFILIFTVAIGTFWEMVEFFQDLILGTAYQASLEDTMVDLIADTLGGVIVAVLGFLYLEHTSPERFVEGLRTRS